MGQRQARRKQKQDEVAREQSYDVQSPQAIKEKQKWMKKQVKQLSKNHITDWEVIFDGYCKELQKNELNQDELNDLLKRVGTRVNGALLHLLFSLFDANSNGVVDRTEFLISMNFLTQANSSVSILELAFLLFDSNRSGFVSKAEFSEMTLAMMNKARFVLAVDFLREAFRKHLESEVTVENLDFFEALERVRIDVEDDDVEPLKSPKNTRNPSILQLGSTKPDEEVKDGIIPVQAAREIYEKFIAESGEFQVNLSDANRKGVEELLASIAESQTHVSSKAFDNCVIEILHLMESDPLQRFKEKLRHNKSWLGDQVWKQEGIKPNVSISKKQFMKWAKKNPGVFDFLQELRITLGKAENRQKLLAVYRIQRAFRKYRKFRHFADVVNHVVEEEHQKAGDSQQN